MKTKAPLLLAPLLALAACGQSSTSTGASSGKEARISGVVLNDDTPVTRAKIEAQDRTGQIIARTEINGDNHYSIKLPAGAAYPVVLIATHDGDPPQLKAAVTSDWVADQDLSSVTTLVVDTAMNLGGLTEANLAKAAGAAISQRKSSGGSGSSSGFKGDPTKQYGGWH